MESLVTIKGPQVHINRKVKILYFFFLIYVDFFFFFFLSLLELFWRQKPKMIKQTKGVFGTCV